VKKRATIGDLKTANDCGGKAYQLQQLKAAGFAVPDFIIFDKHEIRRLFREPLKQINEIFGGLEVSGLRVAGGSDAETRLAEGGLRVAGGSDAETRLAEGGLRVAGGSDAETRLAEVCRQARDLILACDLSADESSLLAKINEGLPAGSRFAIRSSAIGEDSLHASFAGQHESFLYCPRNELVGKLKACVASAWSVHAIRYRLLKHLPVINIDMPVIIQEMIFAAKSGIAFSVNINGNLAESALVAGFGPGQGVVSDQTDTDNYFVDRQHLSIRHEIQKKERMLTHSSNPEASAVPEFLQDSSVLNDDEILKIHKLLLDAEKLLRQYADIEFVITNEGQIFLVQLRPVTSLKSDDLIILDNTNIVESYPGITLPLSYSFASMSYEKVFRTSMKAFGLHPASFAASEDLFAHLLAHHQGRIYYRLDNWYKLVQEVYPSKSLQQSWREAVGLQDSSHSPQKFSRRKQAAILFRLASLILSYPRWTARFFKAFAHLDRQFWSWNKQSLNDLQLWNHFNASISEGLNSWHYTLLNDYLAFAAVGFVRKTALRLRICLDETCTDRLFPGNSEMESRQSMVRLSQLIQRISDSTETKNLFENESTENILRKLKEKQFPELSSDWNDYLHRFGDRSLAELKMETKTPRTHPELLVQIIKNNLSQLSEDRISHLLHTNEDYSPYKLVERLLPLLHPARIPMKILIKIASQGLTNRENMRFCRARIHGAARAIFIEFGHRMHARRLLMDPTDIFYLQLDEIDSFAKGSSLEFERIVSTRKSLLEDWKKASPPDRIIYESINYDKINSINQEISGDTETVLFGTGVSAGIASGEALVLSEPSLNSDASGKILITKMTDPGWVFLMSQAAGIISEKGSLLSHTAIIGRELGVPVVVGIHRAMEKIKPGEKVRINGSTGRVERLDS